MPINVAMRSLRVQVRKNQTPILRHIFDKYLQGHFPVTETLCCFCGSSEKITREHVMPVWLFPDIQKEYYINQWNGQKRKYVHATVPACQSCNNGLLSEIERHIKNILSNKPVGVNLYEDDDFENIIRWFEIIHYKFKVHDISQKYIAHKEIGMIEGLKDFPLAVMMNRSLSFFQAETTTRRALRRLSVKDKSKRFKSLLFCKTKNTSFAFFSGEEFMFIEMPQYGTAMFYFFNQEFKSERAAHAAFKRALNHAYPSEEGSKI